MSLIKIWAKTRTWLTTFLEEQAEMAAQTELFLAELPWRAEP
jgi:hypothetical protein